MNSTSTPQAARRRPVWELPAYLLVGMFFGVLLIQSEVVSWYRIQEMFRFQSIFMYGVLGTAFASAALTFWLVRTFGWSALNGEPIRLEPKAWGPGARHRYWIGGTLFGLGWGLAGACPGPIFALVGHGIGAAAVVLLAALGGARAYAALAHRLPH